MNNHLPGLEATVDRIEGEKAVLKTADGQQIIWPLSALPAEVHEGAVLILTAYTELMIEAEKEKIVKTMLSEILKTSDEA